jgi:hypothetical protein
MQAPVCPLRALPTGGESADVSRRPQPNGQVYAVLVGQDGLLHIGGAFTDIGGVQRFGIAALPLIVPDAIFTNGFGG